MDDITTQTDDDSNVASNRGEPPTESTLGGQPAGDSETDGSDACRRPAPATARLPWGTGQRPAHRLERRQPTDRPSAVAFPTNFPNRCGKGACKTSRQRNDRSCGNHRSATPAPRSCRRFPRRARRVATVTDRPTTSRQDGARSGNRRRKRGGKQGGGGGGPSRGRPDKPSKDGQSKRDGSKNDPGRGDGDGQRKRRRGGRGRAKPDRRRAGADRTAQGPRAQRQADRSLLHVCPGAPRHGAGRSARGSQSDRALCVTARRRRQPDPRQHLPRPGPERAAGHGGGVRRHRHAQERGAVPGRRAVRRRGHRAEGQERPDRRHPQGAPDDHVPGHQEPDRCERCASDPGGLAARPVRGADPEFEDLRHLEAVCPTRPANGCATSSIGSSPISTV